MTGFLAAYRGLLRVIGGLERAVGVALIAAIIITITTQVFTRYALNRPIIWVEELAVYSFIWGALTGASLGMKYGRHVRIETFVGHLPARAQTASRILVNLIILAVIWLLVREVGKVIAIESRSTSVSLPWPVPRAWFYSIPMMVSLLSMAATAVYYVLADLATATGLLPLEQRRAVYEARPVGGLPQ
jgi:TRAP-type C4-dicarboxylate transport system permease small subunit